MSRLSILGLSLLAASATACASSGSKLMRPAMLLDTTAPADAALVVFVRASDPCDGGEPFRIVDTQHRFIGESTPSTKFAVRIPPGPHEFFVWQPFGDIPRDLHPEVNQVGALQGDFQAGQTYTVEVKITNAAHGVRKTCFAYQWLAMHRVDPGEPRIADALAKALPLVPDAARGQAAVEAEPRVVQEHIDLGKQKLNRAGE